MPSRFLCISRLATATVAAGALALTAPAVGLASSRPHHVAPTARIALGLMDSGAHPARPHHVAKRHQHADHRASATR
jgi:hypothetical protein